MRVIYNVQVILSFSKKLNNPPTDKRPVKMLNARMVFQSKLLAQGPSERKMNTEGKEMANGVRAMSTKATRTDRSTLIEGVTWSTMV